MNFDIRKKRRLNNVYLIDNIDLNLSFGQYITNKFSSNNMIFIIN